MARVRGPAALKIIGRVFLALGLAALLLAAALAGERQSSLKGRTYAEARVVDLKFEGRGYRPVVEFNLPDGRLIRFESAIGSNPPRFHRGEMLGVRYVREAPQDALIDEFWSLWFVAVLPAILGGIFSLVGAGLSLGARRASRQG